MTNFAFAIPIPPQKTEEQWHLLNEMLRKTITSILNQAETRFIVYVAGHEFPEALNSFNDDRVKFIEVKYEKISDPLQGRKDKGRKRWAIASEYRKIGGGYFMYMDSDDYVHKNLVEYVLGDNNGIGYYIKHGYALDYKNRRIAPIPGAWRKNFNQVCGSSGIMYFDVDDLPKNAYSAFSLRAEGFFLIRNHKVFESIEWKGGFTTPVPFSAGVYNVNNSLNMSDLLVRTQERQARLVRNIEALSIFNAAEVAKDFSIEL